MTAAETATVADELRSLVHTLSLLCENYRDVVPDGIDSVSYQAGFKTGARSAYADVVMRLQTIVEFGA